MLIGEKMYKWATDLFMVNRSITGPGVRETLIYLSKLIEGLQIKSVSSGTKVFDWIVPDEWVICEAYIEDELGNRIIDFKNNNLHLVGYSIAVDQWMELDKLQEHLHSLPEQPDAIPYVTSYYSRSWGFCLSHNQRSSLSSGRYKVFIDSTISPGVLNYGELVIPGERKEEVLLSTYICHPSMANNELSGPIVTTALSQWLLSLKKRKYTYRILFIPETIGSITYLSQNHKHMKENIVAGFVISCVGDNRTYSFVPSRNGETLADRAALHILNASLEKFDHYSYLDRGSDERQYCSPGVDLPVCSIMRSKYDTYPEYHTSLDNLSFISPEGLQGGYDIIQKTIKTLEFNDYYKTLSPCEPQLGKRGMYPNTSIKDGYSDVKAMMNILAYADGKIDLIELANKINADVVILYPIIEKLMKANLIEIVHHNSYKN
jgi:aminopeptidase-like protein